MSSEPCILIVDDELPNRQVLEAILVPEGYAVRHATNGMEALEVVRQGGVDLVLLDVLMPQLDGIETCRQIREELDQPILPVVMVTALSDRSSRTRSKLCGADDYLVKPICEDELLARVRNLLARNVYYRDAARERARAEAEAQRWKLVSDVASVVAVCTDYDTLQHSIRDLLRPHLPMHRFVVLETKGDALQTPASPTNSLLPPQAALCGRDWRKLWTERCVVRAELFARELAPVLESFHDHRPAHGAILPLHVGAQLQGMLVLFTTRSLTEDELLLIDELGPHLTNAVANVRAHVKAKQLNEARDRLSLLLVHDLKNPLSVISMNLEHLSACGRMDDDADALRDSQSAAERMLHMIMDLLDIGRAEEGQLVLRRKRDVINDVVGAVLGRFAGSAGRRRATLSSDLIDDITVDIDRELLMRVLENLVGNALRYVPEGGFVEVQSRVVEGALVLNVSNNGPQFTPGIRARMFEKYGGDANHQAGPNRGLGLYFCRLVLEAHGGTIDAVNLPSGGVTFEMRMPGAEPRAAQRSGLRDMSDGDAGGRAGREDVFAQARAIERRL
jgi:signal transduction histidine kinase/CheY-like chemotaxis protein